MEKPTNPCLYSFFQGLKNVNRKMRKEKSFKKALLKDVK